MEMWLPRWETLGRISLMETIKIYQQPRFSPNTMGII
ncbi:uncharacterized protein CLUP02_15028 [Colletotrichum lupini]|uniref:Uncharacterized protein n=1 Tax=Colletotrichum lupini TaxID=145971 RepID=A0A9Q8WNL9_9PEZI|nr:uncharacterized protein CLUP02_15028 [Colletotrichum lupini]UQC89497.1 hypothetical protein CLUP02_15028 [Colletotrichum lupini]